MSAEKNIEDNTSKEVLSDRLITIRKKEKDNNEKRENK
jgi:hypothetical protein